MEITIKGDPKEIAALVLEIQEQQTAPMRITDKSDESEEKSDLEAELSDPQVVDQIKECLTEALLGNLG